MPEKTTTKEPSVLVQVKMPVSLVDDLRKTAVENDRPLSAEIRRAARIYLQEVSASS